MAHQLAPLEPGREAEHLRRARGWVQNAGQHLDRGRLAGAVRPDECDRLALGNAQADAVDRDDRAACAPAAPARPQLEDFAQVVEFDTVAHRTSNNSAGSQDSTRGEPVVQY